MYLPSTLVVARIAESEGNDGRGGRRGAGTGVGAGLGINASDGSIFVFSEEFTVTSRVAFSYPSFETKTR
jgi:hypothetical protein